MKAILPVLLVLVLAGCVTNGDLLRIYTSQYTLEMQEP